VRLARHEEREVRAEFGEAYGRYAAQVPAFIPRWSRIVGSAPDDRQGRHEP